MTCNPAAATNPQPPYSVIQTDVNDGYSYYDALDVNLSHRFSQPSFHARQLHVVPCDR